MAGANEVFLKQAGTGAAWMGPQSSFDPVLFAREAAYAKIGAEQGKKDEENKAKAAFLKGLKINPEQILANDAMEGQQRELTNLDNYLAKIINTNVGWTPEIQQKAQYEVSQVENLIKTWKAQEQEFLKFRELQKDQNLLPEDMSKNGEMWYAPELHLDDPEFQPYRQEFEDILENVTSTSPRYKDDPVAATTKARTIFRDRHREFLNPIQKPKDIAVLWNGVRDLVTNNIKQVTGSDYNTKTDEYADWDNDVEITLNNGEKKTIKSIKSNAINYYNGSPDAQYSAQYGLSKQPQEIKDKYANSTNPGLDYFLDQVRGYNQDVITSNATKTPGGGNSINFGGYSTTSDWTPTPLSSTITTTRDAANNIYGETDIDGFSVNKGENQLNLDKVVTAPIYYKSNDATQNAVPSNATSITLAGVKPFMAPTFSEDITWTDFEKELRKIEYDTPIKKKTGEIIDNAYEDFLYDFGKRYANAKKEGKMGGIILTKGEQKFLKKIGLQKYIVGGKFVSGEMSWTETNEDGDQILKKEPAAIIPLSYVNTDIQSVTNIDFNKALNKYKEKYNGNVTDFEYLKPQEDKTNTKGSNTDKKNPSVDEAINY